jgi:hypothetical protein
LGLLYGLTVVFAWLRGDTPLTGWAPIMLVGGLIMAALGVTGEHRWRANESARERTNGIKDDRFKCNHSQGPASTLPGLLDSRRQVAEVRPHRVRSA